VVQPALCCCQHYQRGFVADRRAAIIEIGVAIEIKIEIGSIGEAVDNDSDPDFDFDLEGLIVLHCKT